MHTQSLLFKVFGNEERVRLICCLKTAQSVSDLLKKCTLSQSALSQHLSLLKEAGVVQCTRNGKQQIYALTSKKVLSIAQSLLSLNQ